MTAKTANDHPHHTPRQAACLSGSSRDLTYQLDAPDSKLASSVLVESGPVQDKQRDTTMLKEYHYGHLVRWPRGERAAVFLTFDFQGGEDVKPDKNGNSITKCGARANTVLTMQFIGCCGF